MSNITALKRPNHLPDNAAEVLRGIADRIESGEVVALVMALVTDENYEFVMPSPISRSLELATLLQARCLDSFKA